MEKRRKVRKIAHKSCRIVSISFFELIYYSNCATENMREYWLVSPLIILKSTGTDRKSVHQANKWNTHDTNSYIFTCITFLMTKGCHNVNVNCGNVLLVFVSIFFFFRFWKTDFIFCLLSIWVRGKNTWANKWCFVPAKYSIINSWNDNYSNFFCLQSIFNNYERK